MRIAVDFAFACVYAAVGSIAIGAPAGFLANYAPMKGLLALAIALCVVPGPAYARLARGLAVPGAAWAFLVAGTGAATLAYAFNVGMLRAIGGSEAWLFWPGDMVAFAKTVITQGEEVDWITGERRPIDRASAGFLKLTLTVLPSAIVALNPIGAAIASAFNPPFCRTCWKWLAPVFSIRGVPSGAAFRLQHQLRTGRFDELLGLAPVIDENKPHVILEIATCRTCGGPAYATLRTRQTDTSTGKPLVVTHGLVRNQRVPDELVDRLRVKSSETSVPMEHPPPVAT